MFNLQRAASSLRTIAVLLTAEPVCERSLLSPLPPPPPLTSLISSPLPGPGEDMGAKASLLVGPGPGTSGLVPSPTLENIQAAYAEREEEVARELIQQACCVECSAGMPRIDGVSAADRLHPAWDACSAASCHCVSGRTHTCCWGCKQICSCLAFTRLELAVF